MAQAQQQTAKAIRALAQKPENKVNPALVNRVVMGERPFDSTVR